MRYLVAACLLATNVCLAQTPASTAAAKPQPTAADKEAVHRAAMDYLEGFYEGDTAKLVRALRPDMYKLGFWRAKDSPKYDAEKMSFEQALDYARKFKANKRTTPATAPKSVTVFEVQDQTAAAKVTAWWGTDYLLLGKYDGRWMISHILWQGP